jgi:hypothetical protein
VKTFNKAIIVALVIIVTGATYVSADAIGQTPVGLAPVGAPPVFVNVGSWASDVLMWATTAFGGVITTFLVNMILKIAKKAGVQATDALRERLSEIVLNGLNLAAADAAKQMQGKGTVEVKNAIVAKAVTYTQEHGKETIEALGLDPTSGKAVEAIRARIETAIADPNTPTPGIPDVPVSKPAVS